MNRLIILLFLTACGTSEDAQPKIEKTAPDLHDEVLASVEACKADEECMAKLKASDALLGSCPWYEAIGCSAAVAAAGAACVVTEGEACLEALELVAKIGCCDCLPKGKVQDMCKEI